MTMRKHNTSLQCFLVIASIVLTGCSSQQQHPRGFFTSGSREADQRADQRMSQAQQLDQSGDNAKKASDQQQSLFARLGGEEGVKVIVDDFVDRAMHDPRVNWDRKGVTKGGILHRDKSETWNPTPDKVAEMKKHIVQFIALSTGGPSHYDGKQMKDAHAGMKITNAEFDAAVGDMKASLDKVHVPDKEQRELLAIIESTRTQIVEER